MKQLFIMAIALFAGIAAMAQTNPVKWSYSAKKVADKTYEVTMTATVGSGWHIYSQNASDKEGPIPTLIKIKKNPLVTLSGKPKEVGAMKRVFEKAFGTNVRYFENQVSFVQTVKLKGTAKTSITGSIEYGVCNDERCLPPTTVDFKVAVGG